MADRLFLEIGKFHVLDLLARRSRKEIMNLLFSFGFASWIRQKQAQGQPQLRAIRGPISLKFLFVLQIRQWKIAFVPETICSVPQFPTEIVSSQRIRGQFLEVVSADRHFESNRLVPLAVLPLRLESCRCCPVLPGKE